MNPILEKIKRIGLVPVIKIDDAEKAVPLARALSDGGIPVAEVTFRTDCAAEAIANIARELPDVLVGAGTVVSVEQVKAAVDAGAKYIISPGFDSEVVKYCIENDIPITPGCSSASDVGKAVKLGLECVKFFPAETVGGLKALKALAGPFPKMKFIPTGGINPDNLGSYLAFNKIIACGGSWMVPQKLVDANDWQGITEIARQAVTAMLNLRIVHIGINSDDEATCRNTCALLSKILCAPLDERSKSIFVTKEFEVMKFKGVGTHGHIGIGTSSVPRAIEYFTSQGIEFDADSITYDDAGEPKFVYFKGEFGGFGIHLVNA
ncbi:MAG: bifunctional 4-hydroxy-2-oxoglutarate aldolase/2-dehydro-3-deoxy-phosphogluconate aldolase [Oscillospiraceae bacterium]|nr:bifunctional 4-hydroxy-2-oxoglutarate aldolase/2-dehydro-3-deoxy-phosphogluconate aldolase [Oscillospiraceae bacterium]